MSANGAKARRSRIAVAAAISFYSLIAGAFFPPAILIAVVYVTFALINAGRRKVARA